MQPDEIQSAIGFAEAKRVELVATQPAVKHDSRVVAMLPKLAEEYRRQISEGLDGSPRAPLKVRALLRQLYGGKIWLKPSEDGSLGSEGTWQVRAPVPQFGGFSHYGMQ
jgi:hypothetical protein